MQANNGSIILTVVLCAILVAGVGYLTQPEFPIQEKIIVPTAAEIAALITVPSAPVVDTSKIDALWDNLFGECIKNLEVKAENKVINKLSKNWDDAKEYIEDNFEDFEDFDTGYGTYNVSNIDKDETEVVIINLGECKANSVIYNEDEDSKVTVILEYDFKYTKDTGVVDNRYRGTLYVTADYTYDIEDSKPEVEFTYSL